MLHAVWALAIFMNAIAIWMTIYVFNDYDDDSFDGVMILFAQAEVIVVAGWLLTQTSWWRTRYAQEDLPVTLSPAQKYNVTGLMVVTHLLFLMGLAYYLMMVIESYGSNEWVRRIVDNSLWELTPTKFWPIMFVRFAGLPCVAIVGTVITVAAVGDRDRHRHGGPRDVRVLVLQLLFASLTGILFTWTIMWLAARHTIVVGIVVGYAFFAIPHISLCIDLCRRRLRADEEWRRHEAVIWDTPGNDPPVRILEQGIMH